RAQATQQLHAALGRVEQRVGGRLGVAVLDTGSDALATYRGDERFALCSTFKLLLAGQVLQRADQGLERLDARVRYGRHDLVEYSPRTEPHAGGAGMTVAELCEATMVLSDNSAANLLLRRQGGHAGLTAWLRTLGDAHTRLDRIEPALNDVPAGELRDTTTPRAMVHTVQKLVLGDALSGEARARLQGWLLGNLTGDKRLRAGMPAGWRIGEKTGTANGTSNDVGVVWPEGGAPAVVACYLTQCPAAPAQRDAAIAEVGSLAAAWLAAAG
uniref:class A beta-lactamase n=1 Tax=Diaphorobacter nitroreducens TaxID=164759 RepID=UPI0028B089C2